MAVILVIGNGGREHAIAWKLSQSNDVEQIIVAPGNAGTRTVNKTINAKLDVNNNKKVIEFVRANRVNLVVVGPEVPLANGLADDLSSVGIRCFGPKKSAAQIEASKDFSKAFMDRHEIPTARWRSFTNATEAKNYINSAPYKALVVKADGLAAGKGVVVAESSKEACQAVDDILQNKSVGSAGDTVVVEELLVGPEVSVLCFSDGTHISVMPTAQDHKRIYENDQGPNTGGMGAYAPCPFVSEIDLQYIEKHVMQKAVDGLRVEGHSFIGVLFAGLILTSSGPKVLEYNCRFGDPETETILPLLESDLLTIMEACVDGHLDSIQPKWKKNSYALGIVLASAGYPASSQSGKTIMGLDKAGTQADSVVFHAGTTVGPTGEVVTNGGRVLIAVSLAVELSSAQAKSQFLASTIQFDGKQFRRDIGQKGVNKLKQTNTQLSYKDSGVDITAGDDLVQTIKPFTVATNRLGTMGSIGGFGGLFDPKVAGYIDPILVSGTDGVGTKLKVAIACNIHHTVGIDLVAMCVNDVLAHNAEPLFFLDYFACGKLDVEVASQVIKGIADGCRLAGCSLVGGETAEMPGVYGNNLYDLAGFTVGAVERGQLLPRREDIKADDVIIGISSSGIHSNGFSLVRKIVERSGVGYEDKAPFCPEYSLGEVLLTPTKIYTKFLLKSLRSGKIKAFAHITGGGLTENIPRVLPEGTGVHLDAAKWKMLPVFGWLSSAGNVPPKEMQRTFNCSLGAILVVAPEEVEAVKNILDAEPPVDKAEFCVVGNVTEWNCNSGAERVVVDNFERVLRESFAVSAVGATHALRPVQHKKKVAVLISGSGTNLQALIDFTTNPVNSCSSEITLVLSNVAGVQGLKRAEKAGIKTKVIDHKGYKSRVEFDMTVHSALLEAEVDLVCLAGFMRILSGEFTKLWEGKMLNIHPALLPSFKGAHGHQLAIDAGVRVTGCTVHFVSAEVDAGAIIVQECVPVDPWDTVETLQEKMRPFEHKAYVKALELVASEQIKLGSDGKPIWKRL